MMLHFAILADIFTPIQITQTIDGFQDWKHALGNKGALSIHASSAMHTEAMPNLNEYKKGIECDNSVGSSGQARCKIDSR